MPSAVTSQQIRSWITEPRLCESWLSEHGVPSSTNTRDKIKSLSKSPIPLDVIAQIVSSAARTLGVVSSSPRVFQCLVDILGSSDCPISLAAMLANDADSLGYLMRALDISEQHADLLTSDLSSIEILLQAAGQPTTLEFLSAEVRNDIKAAQGDFDKCVATIRRIHRREFLRIVQGDLMNQQRFETVVEQNTFLAEAILRAAVQAADDIQAPRLGAPPASSRFVVIGLGSFGGGELDFTGHLEAAFLYDHGGENEPIGGGKTTGPKSVATADYYQRITETVFALLREAGEGELQYQISIRNATSTANVAMRSDDAWKFYDTHGETWDRLQFIQARPVAGALDLGYEFLTKVETTVYRRYLSQIQIASIKTFRRQFDRPLNNDPTVDILDGAGGILDVEFVTKFLQLINGGDLPDIRVPNTIEALRSLKEHGCLTGDEMSQLSASYAFLRTVRHRLQTILNLDRSDLPIEPAQLLRIARSVDLSKLKDAQAISTMRTRIIEATSQNHAIVRRLSFDAFGATDPNSPIVDLILNPAPRTSLIESVLSPHGFRDGQDAYEKLMSLATEKDAFLSKARCRHFLATIAPRLLPLIADTPSPDDTLSELDRVSDSLGGKGALWELFHSHPSLMELYVRICAACPYLSGILVRNPGMIDALLDSLMLNRLPSYGQLADEAASLCQGADNIEQILHGFKNANHLSVGVRDVWGKDDIRESTATLADIAEICIQQVTLSEYNKLVPRLGVPTLPHPPAGSEKSTDGVGLPQDDGDCGLVVLGLGKLGGREPNYHSDLDVLFVYQSEGQTGHPSRSRNRETTSNQHFFGELAHRVTRAINRLGPWGRLYEMDTKFSDGSTNVSSISLESLCKFVAQKSSTSDRQRLLRARPIFGSQDMRTQVMADLRAALNGALNGALNRASRTDKDFIRDFRASRIDLEQTASSRNLKRAAGGTIDIETIVQMLQLRHSNEHPELNVPGTLEAIKALEATGILDESDAEYFFESYSFLRTVEARLRLMDTVARHDLPNELAELAKLAYLLNLESGKVVVERCNFYRNENRKRFDRWFATTSH